MHHGSHDSVMQPFFPYHSRGSRQGCGSLTDLMITPPDFLDIFGNMHEQVREALAEMNSNGPLDVPT